MSRHGVVVFLEKFIDKYNDFYSISTHLTQFLSPRLSSCQSFFICLGTFELSCDRSQEGILLQYWEHSEWAWQQITRKFFFFFLSCSILKTMAPVWIMASSPSWSMNSSVLSSSSCILSLLHSERFDHWVLSPPHRQGLSTYLSQQKYKLTWTDVRKINSHARKIMLFFQANRKTLPYAKDGTLTQTHACLCTCISVPVDALKCI